MSSVDVNKLCLGCMNMLPHPNAVCPYCGWSRKDNRNNNAQLAQGTTLTNPKNGNKYLIGKTVGQGGFGIVYVAFDLTYNRKVAIKEYYPTQFVSRDHSGKIIPISDTQSKKDFLKRQRKRFFQEAEKMQLFNDSANVVNVLDYFEENNTAYIVMEFIEGQTFEKVLDRMPNKKLPLHTVLANFKPLIDILERIHHTPYKDDNGFQHNGITHRDISPENIMYAADGTLKLLDFGAARVSEPGDMPTGIIKPGYAPLEQYLTTPGPDSLQGPWTDVYALAATIYRAITGHLPPISVDRLGTDTLILPSAMGIEITPHEEQVLLKGLAVKYQNRYQDISQFYNDLIAPVFPPPPTPPTPPSQPPQTQSVTQTQSKSKISWAVAAVAVIIAFLLLNKEQSHKIELANIQQQIKENEDQLERYRSFAAYYGYASSSYYAESALVFMNKNSESKVPIYCDLLSGDLTASMNLVDGRDLVSIEWESAFNQDKKANVIIKSGDSSGYATIHFTNQVNNDNFDVLVVIR